MIIERNLIKAKEYFKLFEEGNDIALSEIYDEYEYLIKRNKPSIKSDKKELEYASAERR